MLFLTLLSIIFINKNKSIYPEINYIRGVNAFSDSQYNYAVKFFTDDLKENPKRTESLYKIAQAYMLQKNQNINNAIKYYKTYINNNNLNEIVDSKLIENIQFLGMSEELNTISNTLNNEVLKAQIWASENPEKALGHLKLVLEENKNKKFYEISSHVNFALNKYKDTLNHIEIAESLGVIDVKLFYIKSQAQRMLAQFDKAKISLQAFDILNSIDKPNTENNILRLISDLKPLTGELNQDLEVLEILQFITNKKYTFAKNNISNLVLNDLTIENRVKLLEAAILTNLDILITQLYVNINIEKITQVESVLFCKYFSQSNDFQNALNFCEQSLKSYPNLAPLYFWHGIALIKSGHSENAIEQIKTAIHYAPWVNKWRIQLAEIYLTLGELELATEIVNNPIYKDDKHLLMFKNKYGLKNK